MIRILFLLLAWFVAVPAFSQGKPASPSTQEQLLELRLEQQHLKEKLDDQKASLEEKFDEQKSDLEKALDEQKASLEETLEVKKENLSNQRGLVEWWLSALGVLVTFVGVVLPIVGFIYGKKAYADIKKQKDDIQKEQKGLKDWIEKKQEKVEQMHEKQSEWMRLQRITASLTSNKLKKIVVHKRRELDIMLAEADSVLGRIKERDNNCKRYEEILKIASESETNRTAQTGSSTDGEENNKFDFSEQAKEIEQSNDATPFQKAMAKALELYFAGKHEESIKQHLLILNEYKSELTLVQLPDFYFRLAYSFGKLKEDDNAIKYYEKLLALDPTSYAAWNNLGAAYESRGDYDFAIEKYNEAIRLKSDYAKAWNNLGNAYNNDKKKDYDTAIEKYNEAIRLKPNFAEAWNNLGNAYLNLKEYNTAILKYNEAIRLKSDYAMAWNNLGNAYNNDKKKDYDTAIEKYNQAIRLKPDYAMAWYNLGNAYNNDKKKDYDTAIGKYNEAIRLKPDYAKVWNSLGDAYNKKGEYNSAIEKYNEAIKLVPDNGGALGNLAELLIIQNRNAEETLFMLRAAIKMVEDGFNHLLLETIWKVKSKTYAGAVADTFEQLKQTVNDDANKVAWDFKIFNGWLAREKANPTVLDEEAREFITDLIRQIEEWRGGQPKAE